MPRDHPECLEFNAIHFLPALYPLYPRFSLLFMKAIRPLGSGNEKDNAGSGCRQKLLAIESCCQLKKRAGAKGRESRQRRNGFVSADRMFYLKIKDAGYRRVVKVRCLAFSSRLPVAHL
jgi:hypothetical protein